MNITEVRVKLMHDRSDRLRAFCSVTIDNDFVVHDLRVIEGRKGLFVAMPSRKLSDGCPHCNAKNDLRARFCGGCGKRLPEGRSEKSGRDKLHVDVAHPINTPCREALQRTVLVAFEEEERRAKEGLAPLHAYDESSFSGESDELTASDYEEPHEQPEEVAEQVPSEPLYTHIPEDEPDLEEPGGMEPPQGGDVAPQQPDREDSGAPAEKPATADKPRPTRRERPSGGFGEGIL